MTSPSDSAALLAPVPQMRLYCEWLKAKHGLAFATYEDLRRGSVDDLGAFWRSVWDWDEIESPTSFTSVLSAYAMTLTLWFASAYVNYAWNLFRLVAAS